MPAEEFHLAREVGSIGIIPVAPHPASGGLHSVLRQSRDGPALSRQNRILTIDTGTVYRASSQAGPGNDINAGSKGVPEGANVEPCQPGCHPGKREPSRFETTPSAPLFRDCSGGCPSSLAAVFRFQFGLAFC